MCLENKVQPDSLQNRLIDLGFDGLKQNARLLSTFALPTESPVLAERPETKVGVYSGASAVIGGKNEGQFQ